MSAASRLRALALWLVLGSLVGVLCGAASASFLWLLDRATSFREGHTSIVYALPLAGLVLGAFYQRFGSSTLAGNDLVIETLHHAGPRLPVRMVPMVLLGTVWTHLFGGSAGREGTAVQMGASLSDCVAHRLQLSADLRRQLLTSGIAGGFGSVFGTPIAGAVFGLELGVQGRLEYRALVPALTASVTGDLTTRALGIEHTFYPAVAAVELTPGLALKWLLFAAAVAAVSGVYIELTGFLRRCGRRWVPGLPARLFVGGLLVVALWKLVGTSDYLGLGVPTILRAFHDPYLPVYAFALKLLFTALTLGAGFIGGEVTPLFFVGAALGSVLARWLDIPLALGAGVGLAAMFATAANTPLSLSIMAVELLGVSVLPHVLVVAALAYVLAGQRGIYGRQRVVDLKGGQRLTAPIPLGDLSTTLDSQRPAERRTP